MNENNIENPTTLSELNINNDELLNLYTKGEYRELSLQFIKIFKFFERNTLYKLTEKELYNINTFVHNFLFLFIKENYNLDLPEAIEFIKLTPIISNVVAISDFINTDAQLKILSNQKNNFAKMLTLYSSRNHIELDYDKLFATNAQLTSLWYFQYFLVNDYLKESYYNIIRHLNNVNENLSLVTLNINEAYFACTYLGAHNDKKIKNKINRLIQESYKDVAIQNTPNKKKIAIISGKWTPGTAVYKSCFDFIKSMEQDYNLTLITVGPQSPSIDTSIFKDVKNVSFKNGALDISQIQNNDFQFAYFPDIGMTLESILLANLRIAPIQAAGYGHPGSTYGAEIDYWIGGAAVEIAEKANFNYSERLVLIPGLGQHPVFPNYKIQNYVKNKPDFIINCPWGIKKINGELLNHLKEIKDKSPTKLLFRFFVSGAGLIRINNYIPIIKKIKSILGSENVEIYPEKNYQQYMSLMEEGDITLDSYTYGGYNSMVDTIYLRKPFVAFEGDRFFSRAASQLLRELDLPELISTNWDEYVNLTLKLIKDTKFRKNLNKKFENLNLNEMLFFSGLDKNFKTAVDYLIENHEQLKNDIEKTPIFIKQQ